MPRTWCPRGGVAAAASGLHLMRCKCMGQAGVALRARMARAGHQRAAWGSRHAIRTGKVQAWGSCLAQQLVGFQQPGPHAVGFARSAWPGVAAGGRRCPVEVLLLFIRMPWHARWTCGRPVGVHRSSSWRSRPARSAPASVATPTQALRLQAPTMTTFTPACSALRCIASDHRQTAAPAGGGTTVAASAASRSASRCSLSIQDQVGLAAQHGSRQVLHAVQHVQQLTSQADQRPARKIGLRRWPSKSTRNPARPSMWGSGPVHGGASQYACQEAGQAG